MEQFLPYILSAVGGTVLGPILSKVLGGKGAMGIVGGLLGGLAGGYGMDAAGVQMLGGSGMMDAINNLLQGGIGGGVLGGILGLITKSRD